MFQPVAGSRPAVVTGLVNGVAVGLPLLAGVAAGDPEAGALACLGAYVAAFTNAGGPRRQRTTGLAVAAVVNALAFWTGELVTGLFPLALAALVALVFLAGMGAVVHGTVARLGTMPATALLAGSGQVTSGAADTVRGALLVLAGGVWYAFATSLLTPAPRLRGLLATLAQPYREAGRQLGRIAAGSVEEGAGHARVSSALRRAEEAARVLHGPGGDERLARAVDPLLRETFVLADLTAALARAGSAPRAVHPQVTAATEALAAEVARTARLLSRSPRTTAAPDTGRAMQSLGLACDTLRARAADGHEAYAVVAEAARRRRLLARIRACTLTSYERAVTLSTAAGTRLHPVPKRTPGLDAQRLRGAMTLGSLTYRHALRVTAVCAFVFTLVRVAGLPHGEWATLAVLRVLRPQYGATFERAGQRIVGNLVGGTAAALLISGVEDPEYLAILLFAVISAGFALRPVNYAFWVVFGTPLVLLIGDVAEPGDWHAAVERICMTLLGSAAALLGGYLLWPTWDHERLTDRTAEAIRATAAHLDSTLKRMAAAPLAPASPAADRARRRAEDALAEAEEAQRRARTEPGHDPRTVADAATALADLSVLMEHLGALAAHATPHVTLIPGLTPYRAHAAAALTAPGPAERADHAAALADAVEEMGLHLAGLHTRRLGELRTGSDEDTATRRAIRAEEPVIALLGEVATRVARLSPRIP
ncbi:FUSC family protein [Streptomyces vinaceus]|uniref:FUSC family protein n=1 Tax=Streptomyces vinaceus TaxID=1960 RepID=UPI0036821794